MLGSIGTARSVRYDVLLDEIGLGGDEIQLMVWLHCEPPVLCHC